LSQRREPGDADEAAGGNADGGLRFPPLLRRPTLKAFARA